MTSNDDPAEVARALRTLADELDGGYGATPAGAARRGARLVQEQGTKIDRLEAEVSRLRGHVPTPAPGRPCPRCGNPIEQARRGRPRVFCSDCAPRKNPENATLKDVTTRRNPDADK